MTRPPPPSLPLSRLIAHAADCVQAVRGGRSLTDAIATVPEPARPGTQALAFHALRWLGSATAVRARLAPKAPPPAVDALLITALALLWPQGGPPYDAHTLVDQAVDAARRRAAPTAAFVNAVLRRFLRETDDLVAAVQRDPVGAFNHPAWWIERVRADWPGQWERLLEANNDRPPMTLRVNARRGDAAGYAERLAERGLAATVEGSYTVVMDQPVPVGELPGFAQGDVSVQDAAAQRAAPLLLNLGDGTAADTQGRADAAWRGSAGHVGGSSDGNGQARMPAPGPTPPADRWQLAPGARVLDACAAPGGKTAHLLERADLDLLAIDVDAPRLARVQQNLDRLGLQATLAAANARDPARWWDGRPFDAIMLDAPCSASGVVRRHPDVRWLRRPSDISALVDTQRRMLDALWPLLAPGGRLLYVTCSIFTAEGQAQCDAFLQRQRDASPAKHPVAPGHLLPLPDNPHERSVRPGGARASRASDGFFYALIEKQR